MGAAVIGESVREGDGTYDVVVVGAGMAGLYSLHKLRKLGFRVRVLEMGDGIGGTWFWNCYPGARVDVEGIEYGFSFSPEIEQEWDWSEVMPTQPELERYLNFVADRLDLRRDIQLNTRVRAATFDEATSYWTLETEAGQRFTCRYFVAATGCLSAPLRPEITGLDAFEGDSLFTNRFPREGYDFSGKRTAVIGTGSSGVQTVPVVAEQAEHLYVLQRSAAFSKPANNRALSPEEMAQVKAEYPELRRRQLEAFAGTLRHGAVTFAPIPPEVRILTASEEERLARLDQLGWRTPWEWADVMVDPEANAAAVELYAELVRRTIARPEVAEALIPDYPLGCKRLILDTDYYETFNRANVTLVDLRKNPIERVTASGIQLAQNHLDLDVIVYATGFDALTGALSRIDVRGRGGLSLRDIWTECPASLLGLQVVGFPNLFTITGPGSPNVLANMVLAIEQHVDWIADCLVHLRDNGFTTIEPSQQAQDAWVEHVTQLADNTPKTWPSCNSWYVGSNVTGKPRMILAYMGGLPRYRLECDEIAAAGYKGFYVS